MPIILFCLARTLLQDVARLAVDVETYAVILALAVFAVVFRRLRIDAGRTASTGSEQNNPK